MTVSKKRNGRILFLSQWFPFPADNGSKLRIHSLLSGLAKDYEITLVGFDNQPPGSRDTSEAYSICQDLHLVPQKPFNPRSLKARMGYLSLMPRSVRDTYSNAMAQRVREVASTWQPDLIIASELGTAVYHPWFGGTAAVFEDVEPGLLYDPYSRAASTFEAVRSGLTWWKHRRFLADTLDGFQKCTVVSEQERDLLLKIAPRGPGIEVVPNCINLANYLEVQETWQPNTLIFTGSFAYYPNFEAMVWFLEKVYPQIKASIPTLRLTITGDPADRSLPTAADVVQSGHVKDVRPLIAASTVCVVPLRSGSGTRLKILEAMALRRPVVSTRKGAEGLQVKHDSNILIADSPDEFAVNVIRLLQEPETRSRVANNAFELVQNTYEWSTVMPRFVDLVENVIQAKNLPRTRLPLA